MMNHFLPAAVFCGLAATLSAPALAADDAAAVVDVLDRYQTALNAADVAAIVKLYTPDGVQMAPDTPAAVGAEAVAASYEGTFKAIDLKLTFTVDEVKLLGPRDALIRSHSQGTVKVNGGDQPAGPAAFKELFVLHRQDGEAWKLSHYSFSAVKAD